MVEPNFAPHVKERNQESPMRNILALTSVLALAPAAPIAGKKPGDNNGNGHGNGQANSNGPAASSRSNDNAGTARGNQAGQSNRTPPQRAEVRDNNPGRRDQPSNVRINNAGGQDRNENQRSDNREASSNGRSGNSDRNLITFDTRRFDDRGDSDRFRFANDDDRRRFAVRYDEDYGPLSGFCPPGLAKKGNGCQPPGQARKSNINNGYYLSQYSRFRDGDWRYYNGYAYQIDTGSDLINAFLPIVGGALFNGNRWPTAYQDYRVPQYYDRYYGRNDDYNYRYADRAIFRVDPQDQAIEGIVALLTGNDFVVGRQMPAGYDVYNVPYQYREQYYDRPDAQYRYSDGYVYQVDPETRLIAAVIELIV